MKEYTVTVNFAGFIGCEEEYTVYADNEEDAKQEAFEQACADLEVLNVYTDDEEDDEESELDLARDDAWDEVMA